MLPKEAVSPSEIFFTLNSEGYPEPVKYLGWSFLQK